VNLGFNHAFLRFNVQRSTRNFQWVDRKGAGWAEYGDRHGVMATGIIGLFMALLLCPYLQR